MIADKGKFIITLTVTVGLLIMLGICLWQEREVPPFLSLAFGSVITYVFVNGKQLVSPFTPQPMIVPTPEKARELAAKELAASERQAQPDAYEGI